MSAWPGPMGLGSLTEQCLLVRGCVEEVTCRILGPSTQCLLVGYNTRIGILLFFTMLYMVVLYV
jgi:hypothetical protein